MILKRLFILSLFLLHIHQTLSYNLTLLSFPRYADGLGRIPILIIDMLKDYLTINTISHNSKLLDFTDIKADIIHILDNQDKTPGDVCLCTSLLWTTSSNVRKFIPNSPIKLAYSMLESTEIPKQWVDILNQNFDAVAVPDPFLAEVYNNSGVTIPIFVLPLALYLNDFLSYPAIKKNFKPFTFGISAGFWQRKNHEMLLTAFREIFGNSPHVHLKIHGRGGNSKIASKVKEIVKKGHYSNVSIIHEKLSHSEYLDFFKSLDCYILPSKGEGFSITPREALALGIPCILSNNTAHKEICLNGFAYCIETTEKEPAYYDVFKSTCGYQFNTSLEEIKKGLLDVMIKYPEYLARAAQGKLWVENYDKDKLKQRYLNFIKPTKIILGKKNVITDDYLMTNSPKLYAKYSELQTKTAPLKKSRLRTVSISIKN